MKVKEVLRLASIGIESYREIENVRLYSFCIIVKVTSNLAPDGLTSYIFEIKLGKTLLIDPLVKKPGEISLIIFFKGPFDVLPGSLSEAHFSHEISYRFVKSFFPHQFS